MNANAFLNGSGRLGRMGSVCALCAALSASALGQESDASDDQPVQATDYGTVTLAVQDIDLAQVLEMLSIQTQRNIIASKNVSATISANLYDVTFHEALDAILKVNGYDYVEEGNFIYIYTQAEIEEMEAAKRKTESRIFELEYLSAADANEFVTPLLSDAGKSSFRGDVDPGIKPDTNDVGEDSYAFAAKLVVNDYPEQLDRIAALITELDTPPQQVLIEATILQTTLNEANAFGVDFSVLGSVNFTDLTDPLSGVGNLLAGSDEETGFQPPENYATIGQQTVGGTAGPGGLKIGIVRDDISIFLRVLDEVTDSTVLARPKVMCLNRQRAEVLVGRRVGYLSTTATETTTTQSVEFLDTGIHLMFRPFISRNGMIRLELYPSVSEAALRTVTDAQGLQVTIPDELTNELTTNVRVQDGQTLVLGGLFRESTNVTRRQVPLFGDIPLVGALFRGQDDAIDRTEIMFLITPSVVHDEALWALGDAGGLYVDHVQVGARQGLLPFSRERQTDNYNNRAMEAFSAGNLDKAVHYINNSLWLNSNQPEMIKFRQRVLGTRDKPHERSFMQRLFRSALGELTPAVHAVEAGVDYTGTSTTAWHDETPPDVDTTQQTTPVSDPAVEDDARAFDETGHAETEDFTASNQTETPVTDASDDQPVAQSATVFQDPDLPDQAGAFHTGQTISSRFTDEEHDRFVDRFIYEYFTALGLAYLSPCEPWDADGAEVFGDDDSYGTEFADAGVEDGRPE